MIRISFVITGLGVGGAERMLCRLLSRLDRSTYRPSVVVLRERGPLSGDIERLDVAVTHLDLRPGRIPFAAVPRLQCTLQQQRPALVQTWMYHANLLGSIAVGSRVPVIWNLRSGQPSWAGNGSATMATLLAGAALSRRWPYRIVCCGATAVRSHRRLGYAAGRLTPIPNGFDVAAFRPRRHARRRLFRELGLPPDRVVIGHVARFHRQKDHRTLVAAARLAARCDERLHWVLVGSGVTGENRELVGLVREAGLDRRMHLLGRREDVPELQAGFDLATLSSSAEGFPNTVGEAMASATPCVVTNAGDAARLVGPSGRVVPVRDPEALGDGWLTLAGLPPAERVRLGASARERIRNRFSLSATVRRYEALYATALPRAS